MGIFGLYPARGTCWVKGTRPPDLKRKLFWVGFGFGVIPNDAQCLLLTLYAEVTSNSGSGNHIGCRELKLDWLRGPER